MGFRLVPKSVTLNDLKRRNGRVLCVIAFAFSLVVGCVAQLAERRCLASELTLSYARPATDG